MKPTGGEESRGPDPNGEVAWLAPDTLVQELGDNLMLLDPSGSDVASIPSALATLHTRPQPHLRLTPPARYLIAELREKGFVRRDVPVASTGLHRRTVLASTTALASGMVLSLSLPIAAAASSVVRRPGFWAITEITINYDVNLVDRSFPIKLYVSGLKTEFPEIQEGTFLGTWQVTVDGQTGGADDAETAYYVWLVELSPGSALHTKVADFEDGLTAAPDIPGTISAGLGDIHVLFTYDQGIPPPPPPP